MPPFEIPDQLQAATAEDTHGLGDMNIWAECDQRHLHERASHTSWL
jgi:hypothetical protein